VKKSEKNAWFILFFLTHIVVIANLGRAVSGARPTNGLQCILAKTRAQFCRLLHIVLELLVGLWMLKSSILPQNFSKMEDHQRQIVSEIKKIAQSEPKSRKSCAPQHRNILSVSRQHVYDSTLP